MYWVKDSDGDLGLTFWNIVTFIKYKHSVIVEWFTDYPQYHGEIYMNTNDDYGEDGVGPRIDSLSAEELLDNFIEMAEESNGLEFCSKAKIVKLQLLLEQEIKTHHVDVPMYEPDPGGFDS